MVLLAYVPMFVDTGVNAIYARKTRISTRINSLVLLDRVLPAEATNVTGAPLDPRVADLIHHDPAAPSRATSVFDSQVRSATTASAVTTCSAAQHCTFDAVPVPGHCNAIENA